jgi:hypothetical protein
LPPRQVEFEKAVLQLNDEVAVYNQQLAALDVKINEAKSNGGEQSDELKEARAALKVRGVGGEEWPHPWSAFFKVPFEECPSFRAVSSPSAPPPR